MGFSESVKLKVKQEADFTCCWCRDSRNKVEVHHIIPQADGGSNDEDNAAPLCGSCHDLYGGNPDLRKEIKLRRDQWYDICPKKAHPEYQWSGDNASAELKETLSAAEQFEKRKNQQWIRVLLVLISLVTISVGVIAAIFRLGEGITGIEYALKDWKIALGVTCVLFIAIFGLLLRAYKQLLRTFGILLLCLIGYIIAPLSGDPPLTNIIPKGGWILSLLITTVLGYIYFAVSFVRRKSEDQRGRQWGRNFKICIF